MYLIDTPKNKAKRRIRAEEGKESLWSVISQVGTDLNSVHGIRPCIAHKRTILSNSLKRL